MSYILYLTIEPFFDFPAVTRWDERKYQVPLELGTGHEIPVHFSQHSTRHINFLNKNWHVDVEAKNLHTSGCKRYLLSIYRYHRINGSCALLTLFLNLISFSNFLFSLSFGLTVRIEWSSNVHRGTRKAGSQVQIDRDCICLNIHATGEASSFYKQIAR